MFYGEFFDSSLWWIFPIVMIVLCFFMMRGWRGGTMCGFGPHGEDTRRTDTSDSAIEILDKRYARGDIDREEYKARKSDITKG